MKLNKLWKASLTLGLVISIVGCSSSTTKTAEETSASTATAATEGAATSTPEVKKDPVTFTYFNAARPGKDLNSNETTIGKALEDQTGVNFKIEHLVGDINTKIGVMNASGDYPDVLVPDSTMDKVIDAGAFIPLNDLLDKYAPNIKKLYGPYWDMMKAKDGNIYQIPFEAAQGFASAPTPTAGFWIQRGVLKEFGYPKITTLDEYFDIIKKYKEKYPKIDGKDTIGFETLTDDWRFITISNPPMNLAGFPNDGGVTVDMNTHQATVYANQEITKKYLKKLNEVNSQGLFDKESLVANYDQYLAKLSSGRVLGMFDYDWEIGPATESLAKAGNDDRRYIALPIVYDKSIKDQYVDPPTFVQNRGIGITVKAKDPIRIIQYFDNMITEENQKLINWGIKGETYEVDADGKFTQTQAQIDKRKDPEFNLNFGFTDYNYLWPMLGNYSVFSDGNPKDPAKQPSVAEKSFTEGDKAILKAYNINVFSDLFAKPDERKWYPAWSAAIEQGSPEQIYGQKSLDLQKKFYPKMILVAPDKFEATWTEYVTEFNKLDVKIYEATMTKVVNDRINNKW